MSGSDTHIILKQINLRLKEIFNDRIDLANISNKPQKEQEQAFTTRAFMALFLLEELQITPDEAANSITDGYYDDGVDLVYVDKKNSRIYLGQPKWHNNMKKGISLPELTRFRDGVHNVINLNWTQDNKDLHRFKSDIEEQLNDIDTEIILVFAHTSESKIADNIQRSLDKFLGEQNKFNPDFMKFREYTVQQATQTARSRTRPHDIDAELMIQNFGQISTPYQAVYGSIGAEDIVSLHQNNGNKLFGENLRFAIENSEVNDSIINTAANTPNHFWYFNNGITAICDNYQKAGAGGSSTESGLFKIKKISIINGAQTISSLTKAKLAGKDIGTIKVHFRAISLIDTPEDFATMVTSANNTQNDLYAIDFVATDANQERIRKEAAQSGVVYTFRRGDNEPPKDKGFTIRSATIAAACSSGDLRLAVAVKRHIGGLWENIKKDPYKKLFNDYTSAHHLWNLVRAMTAVDTTLDSLAKKAQGREKLVATHSNRFILFCVYEKLNFESQDTEEVVLQKIEQAPQTTERILDGTNSAIDEKFPDAYPGNIFKNQARQEELLQLLRDKNIV